MKVKSITFLFEGRTNSVFRDPLVGFPRAFRELGVACQMLDLRQVGAHETAEIVRRSGCDVVFQATRVPRTAWSIANVRDGMGVPLALWNLEEPNAVVTGRTLDLAKAVDMYLTLDPRMLSLHQGRAHYLPLFFDESIYYERSLRRNLSAAFLIQYSTPQLRSYLKSVVDAIEARPDGFASTYRPMIGWGGAAYQLLARWLDHAPLGLAARVSLLAKRTGLWREGAEIKPQAFFVNRDEEEKAFIYGRAKIGVGFSRVFGPWVEQMKRDFPAYKRDEHGNCVQLKSRHFEIAGAGAMLLSDASPELDMLFEPGKECVTYDYAAPGDFAEKQDFYLRHETERARIAAAGYARAHREHTMRHRAASLIALWEKTW